tara:strand:+ start:360 stop:812 length:453 start_codon:yes stop_codon:yes gene_type:complete
MKERQERWDRRFMEMAELVSTWSKDPSTKIGVVIVDRMRRVISTGYNGFPRGIDDSWEKYADRQHKYAHVVHGELNAILSATTSLGSSTLYLFGMPGPPCSGCTKHILQTGISRIVSRQGDYPERWADDFILSRAMLEEVGVDYEEISYP